MMTRVKAGPEELTRGQLLELMLGPRSDAGLEHFRDDGHAEDCYWQHRDQLYQQLGSEVVRSWAFKRFEAQHLKR